jgi:hypothetical protein
VREGNKANHMLIFGKAKAIASTGNSPVVGPLLQQRLVAANYYQKLQSQLLCLFR